MAEKERRFSGMRKVLSQISQKVKRSTSETKEKESGYEELPERNVPSRNERKLSNVSAKQDGFLSGDWEGGGTGRSSALFTTFQVPESSGNDPGGQTDGTTEVVRKQ